MEIKAGETNEVVITRAIRVGKKSSGYSGVSSGSGSEHYAGKQPARSPKS